MSYYVKIPHLFLIAAATVAILLIGLIGFSPTRSFSDTSVATSKTLQSSDSGNSQNIKYTGAPGI
jgi:hypothetical protein